VFAYRRRAPAQTMIIALNMSNTPRVLALDATDIGGQDRVLREAISNQRAEPRLSPVIGHVTLAPFEAVAFEVVRQ